MSKRRYDHVRSLYEVLHEMEKVVAEHGNPDKIPELRHKYMLKIREELKRVDRYVKDPLEKPLTEEWRGRIDEEYGEDGTDYRILPVSDPDSWTDDEIDEYIMDEVGYPPINSPYDCTGKRFTAWTSWSRQPIGIVMKHGWGLDV